MFFKQSLITILSDFGMEKRFSACFQRPAFNRLPHHAY